MTRATRVAIIAGSLVVAAAAFVLFKPDEEEPASRQASAERSATAPSERTVRFRAGKPVRGVTKITARKGDIVRFVASADVADEVHLHGYDISRPVAPGKDARFRFEAKLEGIFEAELEQRGVPVARVEVRP